MRVRLSQDAREFLRTEVEYLRHRSPSASRHLLESMQQARKSLSDFPMMGSTAKDGLVPGARRLVIGQYVRTYDVSDKSIEITAIRHGRMQTPMADADADFDHEAEPSTTKR